MILQPLKEVAPDIMHMNSLVFRGGGRELLRQESMGRSDCSGRGSFFYQKVQQELSQPLIPLLIVGFLKLPLWGTGRQDDRLLSLKRNLILMETS